MVDNFEMAESKYGRIYKVAGPRKSLFPRVILSPPSLVTFVL